VVEGEWFKNKLHCTGLDCPIHLKYEQQLHEGEEGSEHYGPEVNVPPDSLRENTKHTAHSKRASESEGCA
jgi:hypothetical protein